MKYVSYADEVKKRIKEATGATLNQIGEDGRSGVVLQITDIKLVDTGRLRNSIDYEASDKQVIIGTNVEYAIPWELGSSRNIARPFLEIGVKNRAKNFPKIAKAIFEKYLGGR